MKRTSWAAACALASSVFIGVVASHADTISLVNENFDSMGNTNGDALPAGWKADRPNAVRALGIYGTAVTAVTQAGGNSLSPTAPNGIYNYFAGTAATATDNAVGFLAAGTGTLSGNLYTQLTNTGPDAITSLNIAYDIEKYRNGLNAAGFRFQLFYSTDGASWTTAGSSFLTSFTGDANNSGFISAPGASVPVSSALNVPIASGGSLYLAWNYSVNTGGTTSNAQGLGVDNVIITGETQLAEAVVPVPTAALGGIALFPMVVFGGVRRYRTLRTR